MRKLAGFSSFRSIVCIRAVPLEGTSRVVLAMDVVVVNCRIFKGVGALRSLGVAVGLLLLDVGLDWNTWLCGCCTGLLGLLCCRRNRRLHGRSHRWWNLLGNSSRCWLRIFCNGDIDDVGDKLCVDCTVLKRSCQGKDGAGGNKAK